MNWHVDPLVWLMLFLLATVTLITVGYIWVSDHTRSWFHRFELPKDLRDTGL